MALPDIVLDDRRFEDIVAEAKRRIPGYTPEWTDLNESDPGMTLVQLFAWLAEMVLWRVNRVPDKSFVKFLELIGIDLKPPVPARAELTFTLTPGGAAVVQVPRGTRVQLADAADGGPVVFETDDNLNTVSATIQAVQVFDGAQFEVVPESVRLDRKSFTPLGKKPQSNAALYLGLSDAIPAERLRHTLVVHAYTPPDAVAAARAGADTTEASRPATGAWEYWAGDRDQWQALAIVEDGTLALTRTGTVVFDAPVTPPMARADDGLGLLRGPQDPRLFWLRYRVAQVLGRGFERTPRLEDVLLNTISATAAETVNDELLGPSDGRPGQRFQLANTPVLAGSLHLEVKEANDEPFVEWNEVRDLSRSGPDDRHFVLDVVRGEVTFGDGTHGNIPPILPELRAGEAAVRDDTLVANIRARMYRWGGGARGNAGPGKITSLQSAIPFVDAVTNVRPSVGGQDAESLEQAKSRAPEELRARSRAVTPGDYEFLAAQTPGARIRRARALPLHHPELEPRRPPGAGLPATSAPVPGVVTVIVVPESDDPKPLPNEGTLALVAEQLDRHRVLTAEVYVVPPKYRQVEIDVRVVARQNADSGVVLKLLKERLARYFHPLTGGDDGSGWEFGKTIFFSETYRQVLTSDGVLRVEADALKTFVDGIEQPSCKDVPIGPDELVWSNDHRVEVRYE
jgi:predicted phage baseplate assembly protein